MYNILQKFILLFSGKNSQFGSICLTKKGETVKSKSERIIANYFYDANINYLYQDKLSIPGLKEDCYPEFYLPDYNVYVKYWGGVGTIPGYNQTMVLKKKQYETYNINLIELFPDNIWFRTYNKDKRPNIVKLETTFRYRLHRFLVDRRINIKMPKIVAIKRSLCL